MKKYKIVFSSQENHCPLEHECVCHVAWTYYGWMQDCEGMLLSRPDFCPLEEYDEEDGSHEDNKR